MITYEERVPLLEVAFRETGMSLPELAEDPGILEDLIQDIFDDLQRSKVHLLGQISVLQARNRDLEDYVHMVAHDLKEPWIEEVWANYLSNTLKYGGRPPDLELGASIRAQGTVPGCATMARASLQRSRASCSHRAMNWDA